MAIRLLYSDTPSSHATPVSARILYHLSLDRSFAYICADVKKREHFLSVLSTLTDDKEEIQYRQEILQDFTRHPSILQALLSLYTRFNELKVSHANVRKQFLHMNANAASFSACQNVLQAQALCLKRGLLFVQSFGDLLTSCALSSRGLQALCSACCALYKHPSFPQLLSYCSKYEHFSGSGFKDFQFTLQQDGHIASYDLIDHKYIHVTDPDMKKKGFSLFSKKVEETIYPCERVYPGLDEMYDALTIAALSDLARLFSDLCEQILERWGSLYDDLLFYDVALKYVKALEEKQVPCTYPTFTQDQHMHVEHLYDLYLLMTCTDARTVVPNHFDMTPTSGGLLVFGQNGSGKTVYLRSLGSMQLLAQAGLPLPCECAEISLFSQLATQFSEAEKEFCEGNDAGRFEQEVRELSAMVDTLQEGALVFLNETFQSTAYAEGAESLSYILSFFPRGISAGFWCRICASWRNTSHRRKSRLCTQPTDSKFSRCRFHLLCSDYRSNRTSPHAVEQKP